MSPILFHLAFPVTDLEEAKRFYVDGLGCGLGRVSASAITLEFKGHQLVGHLTKEPPETRKGIYPRHFGLVFTSEKEWQAMADLAKGKGLTFYPQPSRHSPQARPRHATCFIE